MKLYTATVVLCVFLVVDLSTSLLAAASADYVPIMPGDKIAVGKLVADTDVVVATAVLEDLGNPLPFGGGPGQYSYPAAKFKITKLLKGKCDQNVKLLVQIRYSMQEENPIAGMPYIVFIWTSPEDKVTRGVKLLPEDPQTVGKVNAAILGVARKRD